MSLNGKKILLGITGSIAAFKAVTLLRLLMKEGAQVRCILTPTAQDFVTRGTLSALSGNPVYSDFLKEDGTWNSHIELGSWADLFVIAPVTATTMSKMVSGLADNLLIAVYMAAKCPVVFAPAMDTDMYNHPSTRRNISILESYGNILIDPVTGELASGLYGKGRMEEPEVILERIRELLSPQKKNSKIKRS